MHLKLFISLFFVLKTAFAADRCSTELHPTLGVKGTCMEKADCLSDGGTYLDNWCMSQKATVKCCFFEEEVPVEEGDYCELPEEETSDFCESFYDPTLGAGSCKSTSQCGGLIVNDWCDTQPIGVECCFESINPDNPCKAGGQFYPHRDKSKFIQCAHGWPYTMNCPFGQVWHQEYNWCDFPELFDNSIMDDIDLDLFEFDDDEDDLYYKGYDATEFLQLLLAEAEQEIGAAEITEIVSPVVSNSNDRCNRENHPDFGKGVCKETSQCNGVYVNNWCESQAASIKCCFDKISWDTICNQGGMLYPHRDPTKFIQCAHGWAFTMSCPAGQVWISEKHWCDYV